MPAIRSVQLAAGLVEAGEYLDVYTVPPGVTTLVKSWSISPGDAADNGYRLYVRLQGGQVTWLDQLATTSGVVIHKGLWAVLEAGDVLGVNAMQASAAYHLSGAQLLD